MLYRPKVHENTALIKIFGHFNNNPSTIARIRPEYIQPYTTVFQQMRHLQKHQEFNGVA